MEFSPDQLAALAAVEAFVGNVRSVGNGGSPFLTLQGLAGTGKTTVLAELARRYPAATLVAPTGKAAAVLRSKTDRSVSTIHSAIYDFQGLRDDERTGERRPVFSSKDETGLGDALVLLDEASMTGVRLANDLLATGARVVACGDPGQLPPVADEQFFDQAHVSLTQVHRQALESPIVRQAHAIRHTGRYAADGPDFRVIERATEVDLAACSVALCWRNRTRRLLNVKRRRVLGFDGPTLSVGEPVMCLKNDHALRIYNGEVGAVAVARAPGEPLAVTTPDGRVVTARGAVVEAIDPDYETARHEEGAQPFALAYGLTVHKSQGSEWESVLLIDECHRSDERARFLYTGVTRAQRRATIVPWR